MLAAILKAAARPTWLGGNIGHSLLADLPKIRSDHLVVLELSSFQLHWLSEKSRWPQAAIITNCSPNHLDWHGNWENYVAAKRRLIDHLPPDGIAIAEGAWGRPKEAPSEFEAILDQLPTLRVPGQHNRRNAASAAAIAHAFGIEGKTISRAMAEFSGLPHRLEFVTEIDDRAFYNDSKSTTSAATIAALATMERPTWILLGGADNQSDHAAMLPSVIEQTQGAALFGVAAPDLAKQLREINPKFHQAQTSTLADALNWCWKQSQPGNAILLSPAFPSTDQFRDFTHRGEEFQRLVKKLSSKQK
jgi:UDP-N-acetylmuramoylalanine--D-glutamate ligase